MSFRKEKESKQNALDQGSIKAEFEAGWETLISRPKFKLKKKKKNFLSVSSHPEGHS